jgi:hypothetical protein
MQERGYGLIPVYYPGKPICLKNMRRDRKTVSLGSRQPNGYPNGLPTICMNTFPLHQSEYQVKHYSSGE